MSFCCLRIQSTTSCLEILLLRLLRTDMFWELPLYFLFTPHPATNPFLPCLPITTFPCLIVFLMVSCLSGSNGPVATPLRNRTHPSICSFELSITSLREVEPYEPSPLAGLQSCVGLVQVPTAAVYSQTDAAATSCPKDNLLPHPFPSFNSLFFPLFCDILWVLGRWGNPDVPFRNDHWTAACSQHNNKSLVSDHSI